MLLPYRRYWPVVRCGTRLALIGLIAVELMRKLIFGLLLLLASLRAGADDLCISAISDPDNRPLDRDAQLIVAPPPVYPSNLLAEGSEGFAEASDTELRTELIRMFLQYLIADTGD